MYLVTSSKLFGFLGRGQEEEKSGMGVGENINFSSDLELK